MTRAQLFCLLLVVASHVATADVKVPSLFADHMVIQRNVPVHVWGFAEPGENVTVQFRGQSQSATTDALGRWDISLPAGAAGGPFELEIRGHNTLHFADVLVGDVWFASGQSNMEFPMRELANAAAEIAVVNRPQIRFVKLEHNSSPVPLEDAVLRYSWVAGSPQTAANFSAVAYFFARGVQDDQKVPVGIIESGWDGTTAEAWTSMSALGADAGLMPVFAAWAQLTERNSTTQREIAAHDRDLEAAKKTGETLPEFPWHPEVRSWAPAGLFNAMVAPVVPYAISGAIWYQGESNTGPERASLYGRLFPTMIEDWRARWGLGEFPFFYVQLASYKSDPVNDWPMVREAQRRTLALRNTGMAVTIDIGDANDIHPKNKQDVGKRLALAARAIAYGEKIEYSGPTVRQVTREGNSLRVAFDHAGGLTTKGAPAVGFEVAGEDKKFQPATARIDGPSVVVSSTQVPEPMFVRYAWSNNPDGNLHNSDGLPASPFMEPQN
jgi:sialate O-acetylesterase